MQPSCWVDFVPLHAAMVGVYSGELNIFAKIVAALVAQKTVCAGNTRLYCHSVTGGQAPNSRSTLQYNPGGFVSDDTITLKNESPNASGLPEVNIRPRMQTN